MGEIVGYCFLYCVPAYIFVIYYCWKECKGWNKQFKEWPDKVILTIMGIMVIISPISFPIILCMSIMDKYLEL